ncbi:ATP-binding protein [Rheinheimera sp. 1928-s]|uniref:ATP-binding protein n=1 Tax=Rheinheimera sp. 1928-s TaxID=3033803 RepID=UPI002623753F|nr:ATP-binding protein [Rheinheimera sp. 1928-s]MDF3123878.1 ATP-binding protein [Rheinheimera sp. 1928-s]
MNSISSSDSPYIDHPIEQLQRFRWVLISLELLASLTAYLLHYPIHNWGLLSFVLAVHVFTNISLKLWRGDKGSEQRFIAISIFIDLFMITALLAMTGGASNGFVAILLLPVAVTAVLFSTGPSYLMAILAIGCYSLLLQIPLAGEHSAHQHAHQLSAEPFSQHISQMWWAFSFSAFIVSWFISAQTQRIRSTSAQLNKLQQKQLQHEQVLAVATYAANAAHDLATPLQNLVLLTDELTEQQQDPALAADLRQQLQLCQQIVQQLRSNAQQLRKGELQAQPLYDAIERSVQLWLVSRPEISMEQHFSSDQSTLNITDSISLAAALFNILDNAADASLLNKQPRLSLTMQQSNSQLELQIRDYGPGLPDKDLAQLGKKPSPSEQGLGLGQFLANVSIDSLGGKVERENCAGTGVLTRISFSGKHS